MNEAPSASPTAEEAAFFRASGFLTLPGLIRPGEIAELAEAFDAAVRQATGRGPRDAGAFGGEPPALVTVVSPEAWIPSLGASRLASQARRVMAVLFEVPEERLLCGWRCFLKPSGGGETPWHQDAAYRPPPHRGGTIWLPLDPATLESGCLDYLPGSHRGPLLPHALRGHHYVAEPCDGDAAVSCPLSLGDASVHTCLTVHRAGPNRTARPRRAFAVVCQVA